MLMPWDLPPHRLANVDPVEKRAPTWLRWLEVTAYSCAAIAIVCAAIAYVMVP